MLRCIAVPASQGKGYSQAKAKTPKSKFITCRMGTGRTAPSRFVVRKSQKIFGQKKPSKDAAIWSEKRRISFLMEVIGGRMLTGSGGEDNQACPVVFDELSHEVGEISQDPSLARLELSNRKQ